jgi:hypothetical protein
MLLDFDQYVAISSPTGDDNIYYSNKVVDIAITSW